MIFSGTVVATPTIDRVSTGSPFAVPLSFHVDEAIAGVEPGQVLTIHEWTGARSAHRSIRGGEHILIFLYPLSRLGLTSPVGGSLGIVALDMSGKNVSAHELKSGPRIALSQSPPRSLIPVGVANVSVVQLERAIRWARAE